MVYTAAARAERGEPNLGFISSASKCFASDVAMEVTTDAVQLFGGYGYTVDFPVERFMRDAKITQIYEGTNQIQRVVMSRALLRSSVSSHGSSAGDLLRSRCGAPCCGIRIRHLHQRRAGREDRQQVVESARRRSSSRPSTARRSSAVRPWAAADACAPDEHLGDRPAIQRRAGIALGDDLVAVHAHRGGVVGHADGRSGTGLPNGSSDSTAISPHARPRRRPRRAGRPCTARRRRLSAGDDFGTDPPDPEQHRGGLPVRGQQHRDSAARPGAHFVAQQIAGLGRPVRQCGGGQLDALAGRVVVVGDPRPGGIGSHERIEDAPN